MTEKLYYSLPYTTEWETKIKRTFERDNEKFIILEESAFYPTGGGQPFDTGSINGIDVEDVFVEEDEVVHKIKSMPDDSNVNCKINWDRRFDHMQHHSGQHLLSAVCNSLYNASTVSFHLGGDFVTIDVDSQELSQTQLNKIEKEVNQQIYQNRFIHTYFVSNEELEKIPLIKMPKVTENIRIVEIEGIEHNACGGTHVSRTGEIGIIKLYKTEKQRGNTRIFFKCGSRVLQDMNDSQDILNKLSLKFNTSRDEILNRFEKWEEDHNQLETEISVLKEQVNHYQAKELLHKANNDFLAHVFEDKSFNDMKELAIKLASENNLFVLFLSLSENKVMLANNGTESTSCGKFLKQHLAKFNGKGGGNDKTAQAAFTAILDAEKFYHFASQNISRN
ncbi:DHHA1 domain-containing protein [Bacillus sp. NEB1478]|uniref:alanyl-tRNA editing protein n=1 Tax=Bacillus sp. NEB1478 TaxID=3073816 RepID=UPI002872E6E8|nr:DHHA1 domain-containing protein [Bacillus sp. NEB1478]WNB93857.1 DHHA1 domain-containing protein [Bacillus sp. NEB1478]